MYSPPPGFTDLLHDADCRPPTGPLADVDVPGVGVLPIRAPGPQAAAYLAMMTNTRADDAERGEALIRLVRLHTRDGQYARLMYGMVNDDLPPDAVRRVARAIATYGTARPYTAVVELSGVTGHHWSRLRAKIIGFGIADPMTLPTLHALLDVTEAMVVEVLSHDKNAKRKVDEFYDAVYAPERADLARAGSGWRPPPAGFSDDDIAEVAASSVAEMI